MAVLEELVRADPSTHAEVRRTGNAEVDLDAIWRTSGRGEGAASRLLRALTEAADEHGVTLTLTAVPLRVAPTGQGPAVEPDLDEGGLVAWYGRHGFEPDGEDRGCPVMRRIPTGPVPTP